MKFLPVGLRWTKALSHAPSHRARWSLVLGAGPCRRLSGAPEFTVLYSALCATVLTDEPVLGPDRCSTLRFRTISLTLYLFRLCVDRYAEQRRSC